MMKILFSLTLFLSFSYSVQAYSTCELPRGESIKIGCSYDCDVIYRFRLIMTAWGMGYSAKFVNLQEQKDLKIAMGQVDAILLPGGADIDPKYYLDSITPELREYTKNNLKLVNLQKKARSVIRSNTN